MKKIIAIGVITGIVLFAFLTSCARQMEARSNKEKNDSDVARKNKTEGYFYHQPEQDKGTDSSRIKKSVNN